jgi:hypothetical protein
MTPFVTTELADRAAFVMDPDPEPKGGKCSSSRNRVYFDALYERFCMDLPPAPKLMSFGQMKIIGEALHDRWEVMTGAAPLTRDDQGWGDVVHFVLMQAHMISREG